MIKAKKAKKAKKVEAPKPVKTTETFGVYNVVRVRDEGGRHWEKQLAGNIEVDLSALDDRTKQSVKNALEKALGDI